MVPALACIAASLWLLHTPSVQAQPAAFPDSGQVSPQPFSLIESEESTARDLTDVEDHPNHPLTRPRTAEDDQRIARQQARSADRLPDIPVVREVEVVGAWGDNLKKAQRAVQTRPDEPLDPTRQREDIRRLYELGIFSPDIQVQSSPVEGGVKLQYVVESNPRVGEIEVQGNQRIDTRRILGQLPVKKGEIYTIQAQNRIRDSIARYYEESG